jgi:hypothetical protein
MKNFPRTILTINGEKPFILKDWLKPELFELFDENWVYEAVEELNLTFNQLTHHVSQSDLYGTSFFPDIHSIISIESKEKLLMSTLYINKTEKRKYNEYQLYVPCHSCYSGEIFRYCLLKKYPMLRFERLIEVKVKPYDFINNHIRLNEIPESFKNMTINELLKLDANEEIVDKRAESCLKCYSNFDEIYLETEVVLNGSYQSIYIPTKDLYNFDYNAIEKRTRDYLMDYYYKDSKYKEIALSCLESETAKKLKKILDDLKQNHSTV